MTSTTPRHVYLGDAAALRTDLQAAQYATIGRRSWRSTVVTISDHDPGVPSASADPVYPAAGGYAEQTPLVRLASNESPYPPLPAVPGGDRACAGLAQPLSRPDRARVLRERLSDRYEVPASRIAIGNGSCDILLAAGEALLEPGAEIVHAWPSFSVYPQLSAASGARAITVPLDSAQRHDLPAMLREITVATRLVIVCNPNNPTCTALPLAEIAAFVAQVPPHVCVIVDEAYCEFNLLGDPDASVDLLDRHPNLVLLRTFSKVHGLCGLRVGFALCGSRRVSRARSTRCASRSSATPLAQAAAVEALAHQDAVLERVDAHSRRARLRRRGPACAGSEPADSQANFCWFDLGEDRDEAAVMRGLAGARRARARRRRAGLADARLARHVRHARGERALPGGACRGARRHEACAQRLSEVGACGLRRAPGLLQPSTQAASARPLHAGALLAAALARRPPYLLRLAIYLGASARARA